MYAADNLNRVELMGKIDAIKNHMGNFYDCTLSRQTPISDVVSQHRSEMEMDQITPDYIINNDGTISELHAKVQRIMRNNA